MKTTRMNRSSIFRTRILLTLLSVLSVLPVFAQNRFAIRVSVIDEFTREEMNEDSLKVDVMAADSTMIAKGLSFGRFYNMWFDKQDLLVRFYQQGFVTQDLNIPRPGNRVSYVNLDDIIMPRDLYLHQKTRQLQEVEVVASVIKMVNKGDTIVYNADAFRLARGSMLDQLVKALPGVELRGGGRIYVNGRYVESLLLNGKDFFKGNPTVALSNLPSYMVSKVKVYEQETAYNRISGQKDKLPLVMDVGLKKEYRHGWIANAEAGYGTDRRYVGRVFGLTFTPLSRFALFGNINNTNDATTPGEDNEWNPDWQSAGLVTTHKAGADYLLTDNRNRWEFNGIFTATRTSADNTEETSQRLFIPTGAIAKNYGSTRTSHNYDFELQPLFTYDYKRLLLSVYPSLTYSRHLDSGWLTSSMHGIDSPVGLNSERRMTSAWNTRWAGNIKIGSMLAIPGTPDHLILDLKADFEDNKGQTDGSYMLAYPRSPADNSGRIYMQSTPLNRWNVWARLKYGAVFLIKGKFQNKLSLWYGYAHSRRRDNREYFDADLSADELLPSDWEHKRLMPDMDNTYRSVSAAGNHSVGVSCIQEFPKGNIMFNPNLRYSRRNLDYERFGNRFNVRRNELFFEPSASLTIYSVLRLDYSLTITGPSMFDLLDITDNTDPLYVNRGNSGLKPVHNHSVDLTLGALEKLLHSDTWATVRFGYRRSDRAIARTAVYDAITGVTTCRPMNVNGNWSANATISAGYWLNKRKNLILNTTTKAGYDNSVDMIALERSIVRTLTLSERLKLDWKFMDGFSVAAVGNAEWRRSTSPQPAFATINAVDFDYGLIMHATRLPWDFAVTTDITMHSRRGYCDSRLNDNHLLWNARISKSIMHGNLTFALDGFDLLGQLSNVRYAINAQGRTEQRFNTLPRYALLHIIYRLNIRPKSR